MKTVHTCLLVLGITALAAQSKALGENWPGWRGPRGDGTSLETRVPTKWSGTDNVAWKTPLPGIGHSSPVVWGDRIFLTTAIAETKDRALLCLDRKTGRLLWQKTVLQAPWEAKHGENSYASSTPVTDGEKVFVTFLDGNEVVVAAYDFAGEQKWLARPGHFDSGWGFCHSPVIFEDNVLVACCGKTSGVLAALSRSDGQKVWSLEPKHPVQSFSVPLIMEMAGRMQMIVPGNKAITSYDPRDGKELWTVDGPSTEFIATPVFHAKAGLVLGASSWPTRFLVAIKPDGAGNVTASKVAWQTKEGAPYVPSPIAVGAYVLSSAFEGQKPLCCLEAATGKLLWQLEAAGLHHASPVTANGLVYFLNDDGVTHVVKAGPALELVSRNALGEKTYASPVISQGQIFLRGFNHLYCIGPAK
jgi:outer membrane protein assembly factor BamB